MIRLLRLHTFQHDSDFTNPLLALIPLMPPLGLSPVKLRPLSCLKWLVFVVCLPLSAAAVPTTPSQLLVNYLASVGAPTPSPSPIKAIYIDAGSNASNSVIGAVNAGFNVVIIAFFLGSGPADMLSLWGALPAATKQSTSAYAHANGAVIMLSAGGSTETPYVSLSASSWGQTLASYALANSLDGVDLDIENVGAGCVYGSISSSQLITWMVGLTSAIRAGFPAGLITHAPQARLPTCTYAVLVAISLIDSNSIRFRSRFRISARWGLVV